MRLSVITFPNFGLLLRVLGRGEGTGCGKGAVQGRERNPFCHGASPAFLYTAHAVPRQNRPRRVVCLYSADQKAGVPAR